MIDKNTKIIVRGKYELLDLAGETAIYSFETGRYCTFKGSADAILGYIKNGATVYEIADALTNEYEIDINTSIAAVSDFLFILNGHHFIELVKE